MHHDACIRKWTEVSRCNWIYGVWMCDNTEVPQSKVVPRRRFHYVCKRNIPMIPPSSMLIKVVIRGGISGVREVAAGVETRASK